MGKKYLYEDIPSQPGIYCITNTANDKRYIGYSKNMRRRVNEHLLSLTYNHHYSDKMQKDWVIDKSVFIAEVLEFTDERKREDYWTLHYQSNTFGYNTIVGYQISEYERKRSSERMTGRVVSQETREKTRQSVLRRLRENGEKK